MNKYVIALQDVTPSKTPLMMVVLPTLNRKCESHFRYVDAEYFIKRNSCYNAKAATPTANMPAAPMASAGSTPLAPLLAFVVDLPPDAVAVLVPPECPLLVLIAGPELEAVEGLRFENPPVRRTC